MKIYTLVIILIIMSAVCSCNSRTVTITTDVPTPTHAEKTTATIMPFPFYLKDVHPPPGSHLILDNSPNSTFQVCATVMANKILKDGLVIYTGSGYMSVKTIDDDELINFDDIVSSIEEASSNEIKFCYKYRTKPGSYQVTYHPRPNDNAYTWTFQISSQSAIKP